ncbi:MAG TPA: L-seryl-tRNA(Sec) selenium transferase [Thermoanaerobaculia bacterium]|nr:L-seryl-tRNA(Sec) selenium transferase [Thermoanaerobaculia bacterium]
MAPSPPSDPRRRLPAVDRLLALPRISALERVYGRDALRVQLRAELARLRSRAASAAEEELEAELGELPERLERALGARLGEPLGRVLNATGVFLHTNLGRAPLPREVAAALPALADAGCDLEIDPVTGGRGDRLRRIAALLEELTGAEAALAVNNNAGALVLILATLAAGRDVVVSRGELVEIGGSFRIPEILEAAGARLVEVGTTNRTHRRDYERALGERTGLLLKVLPSNFRARGFTAEVAAAELVEVAHGAGLPLVVDEGSGLLARRSEPQLAAHPGFRELVASGVDLVCGSGDKLLGGPQAGLVVGRGELVARCRRHPLYRAFRLGRLPAAALELVLRRRLAGEPLPLDRLWVGPADHRQRLEAAAARLGAEIVAAEAFLGGGSAPDEPIPGQALALPARPGLAERLRAGSPRVVGYVREGRLILDLRTVDPADDEALLDAVEAARAEA